MTKADLIAALAQEISLPKGKVAEYLEKLIEIMTAQLHDKGEVPLPRLGSVVTRLMPKEKCT